MITSYALPSKIKSYLKQLDLEYIRAKDDRRHSIIAGSRFFVSENTEYDNWNGGTTGHDVTLFIETEILARTPLLEQASVAEKIREDINACAAGIGNEYVRMVRFELADEDDPEYQAATAVSGRVAHSPGHLAIWKPGFIRLFISHRDSQKRKAFELADALNEFGISSFVAHDTIKATKEWRKEILAGLETMEIMLVFLNDDFHMSSFTNQEIGYALGKGVPVVSLKLESADPPGFIAHEQAQRGRIEEPAASAPTLQRIISERLGKRDRIQTGLVSAFVESVSYTDARDRFERIEKIVEVLTESELKSIIEGFYHNSQLSGCAFLTSRYERLRRFLERSTTKQFQISGRKIIELKPAEDEILF